MRTNFGSWHMPFSAVLRTCTSCLPGYGYSVRRPSYCSKYPEHHRIRPAISGLPLNIYTLTVRKVHSKRRRLPGIVAAVPDIFFASTKLRIQGNFHGLTELHTVVFLH